MYAILGLSGLALIVGAMALVASQSTDRERAAMRVVREMLGVSAADAARDAKVVRAEGAFDGQPVAFRYDHTGIEDNIRTTVLEAQLPGAPALVLDEATRAQLAALDRAELTCREGRLLLVCRGAIREPDQLRAVITLFAAVARRTARS